MPYPLAALLRVRKLRESNALSAVKNAETALEKARQTLAAKKKELENYALWWPEEEERRYGEILFQKLSLHAMDDFKDGLNQLRLGETLRREEVVRAEAGAAQAEKAALAARQNLLEARKSERKIDAHRAIWLGERATEAMRLEDLEMEDFKGKKNLEPAREPQTEV
jgi:type III secretion protein O